MGTCTCRCVRLRSEGELTSGVFQYCSLQVVHRVVSVFAGFLFLLPLGYAILILVMQFSVIQESRL